MYQMNKTIAILSITALFALLSAPLVLAEETADATPPNVVLIFVDDLGYGDISLQGCTNYQTPHIDSIAKEGIRFSSGYVSGPACGPSRAALMTGRYKGRFGYDDNRCIREGVPAQEIFMPEMLREAGYITGHIGKWHLGKREGQLPKDRGFDESHTFEGKDLRPRPDWYAKKASEFIREHKDKDQPFFLYLATLEVHTKLAASDERLGRVAPHVKDKWQRLLGGMVLGMDDMVGEVLKTLRDEGLDESTIVFFISDNGASMANPVWIYDGTTVGPEWVYQEGTPRMLKACRSNAPLRGGKGNLYEGGIRVPVLMRWTGKLPAGVTYDSPVVSMDVFSTVAALAKADLPKDRPMDGVNLIPYLTGEKEGIPHEYLFWRKDTYNEAWWKVARKGKWKLANWGGRIALHDLDQDIGEKRNVASQYPEIVKEMSAQLARWDAEVTAEREASGFKYLTMEQWQAAKDKEDAAEMEKK